MIYLDNAATTYPKPLRVARAVSEAVRFFGANPGRSGHAASLAAQEQVFACRSLLAEHFAVSPERIIFTAGCTASLNMVIKGILRDGDHVVLSSFEHNAAARPVDSLARRRRIRYSIAKVDPTDPAATLEAFSKRIRRETKLVICTAASNVFGIMPPIAQIGALCRARGVRFCIDAAQAAGLCRFDFPYDYLCAAGHKGFYGPAGIGILCIKGEEIPYPILEGGTGSASASLVSPDFLPDRLESGTLNTVGILGLHAGVQFVLQETPERLYERELRLVQHAYTALSQRDDVILYTTPPVPGGSMPVLSFNLQHLASDEVAERLNQRGIAVRGGLHCAPLAHQSMGTESIGTVRIAPGAFNTVSDIEALCAAL